MMLRKVHPASSNVDYFSYDDEREVLEIGYMKGKVYRYENISPKLWQDLLAAPSPGQFIWQELRKRGS